MITQEPNNITSFIQLQRLCDGLYHPHFKRAQLFTSIVYLTYSLQFLYICFQVIIAKQPLFEQGGLIFLTYAFSDMLITTIMVINSLNHGAEANLTHLRSKNILSKI